MIRKICLATTAVSGALVLAPAANADESSFLDAVNAAGIPISNEKALTLGRATCGDLRNGIPMSAILAANNPGPLPASERMTSSQNWALFTAAVSELCPDMQSGY
jgi:hypothetical protein